MGAGGVSPSFPVRKKCDVEPETSRAQRAVGILGWKSKLTPGAFVSSAIVPLLTRTSRHHESSGKSSGVPDPVGSVTFTPSIRNKVWLHDPENPPTLIGCPMARPPPVHNRRRLEHLGELVRAVQGQVAPCVIGVA